MENLQLQVESEECEETNREECEEMSLLDMCSWNEWN